MKKIITIAIAIIIAAQAQVQAQAQTLRYLTKEELAMGKTLRYLTEEELAMGKTLRYLTEEELAMGHTEEKFWFNVDTFNKRVFIRIGKMIFLWRNGELKIVCNDFSSEALIRYETLYYISESGYASMANLGNGSIFKMPFECVKKIINREVDANEVYCIDQKGEKFVFPGYFDRNGEFKAW